MKTLAYTFIVVAALVISYLSGDTISAQSLYAAYIQPFLN